MTTTLGTRTSISVGQFLALSESVEIDAERMVRLQPPTVRPIDASVRAGVDKPIARTAEKTAAEANSSTSTLKDQKDLYWIFCTKAG